LVYIGSNDRVFAISTSDGSREWEFEANGSVNWQPTVVNDTVYVHAGERDPQGIYALSAEDGAKQWYFEFNDPGTNNYPRVPAVVENRVYIGSRNYLYAIDATDGAEIWRTDVPINTCSRPVVANGTVLIGIDGNRYSPPTAYAVDASDGSRQWQFDQGARLKPSFDRVSETVYFSYGNASQDEGRLFALDLEDGSEKWRLETDVESDLLTRPAVNEGESLFVGRRRGDAIYSVAAADGSIQWEYETNDGFFGRGLAPVFDGGTVFAGDTSGMLYAISAADGTEHWVVQINEDTANLKTPSVDKNSVYVTDETALYAVKR
jgi:outer membrane protein assembly factor BamB